MALLKFNATEHSPSQSFSAVPTDWYLCEIAESDLRENANGSGVHLWLMFKIIEGIYTGQSLFTNLNIEHSNPMTVKIANGQLSSIAHAVGVLNIAYSEMLHNIPLKVRAKYVPANDDYDEQNHLVAFKDANAATKSGAPNKASSAKESATKASAKEAWKPNPKTADPAPDPDDRDDGFNDGDALTDVLSFDEPVSSGEFTMLPAANGISYEDYRAADWSDDDLLESGFMARAEAKKSPLHPPPKKAPKLEKPAAKSAPADTATTPPWKKRPAAA